MSRILNICLVLLMCVVPMGIGEVTRCDVNSVLGLERHHHEGEWGSHSECPESEPDESHRDCEPVPCSDELVVSLSGAAMVRVQDAVPLQHFTAAMLYHLVMAPLSDTVHLPRHTLYAPPDIRLLLSTSEFTGRYLI